jgi:CRP/FNR family transcriptional regulator, cyclic AMP receptor protein
MTIRTQNVLDRLPAAVHARLAQLTRPVSYPAGGVVLREGDDTPFLAVILEGRIALRLRVPERGDRVTIVTVEQGEFVGWSALVAPYRATVDAVATEDTRLLAIDAPALRSLMALDRELSAELLPLVLDSVSGRLTASWQQLLDMFGPEAQESW